MNNRPIGVFDSGLGGLSAVRALRKLLPNEDIVYFGDTGRVPYGNRSKQTITQYARSDVAVLAEYNVKFILAACGTVSSNVDIAALCGDLPCTGVIEPAVSAAISATKRGIIGVAATAATINSGVYREQIGKRSFAVHEKSCPLFVPLVESGYIEKGNAVSTLVAEEYLLPLKQKGIDTLILGCTHYPLLAPIIGQVLGERITLIDSGAAAAAYTAQYITKHRLETDSKTVGKTTFLVSDLPQMFNETAELFMGHSIKATSIEIKDYT